MDSRIRPASSHEGDIFPKDLKDGVCEGFLNGRVILLDLKTAVIGSVIGNTQ